MVEQLIQFYMRRPFVRFAIRLEGGFELKVLHQEFMTFEPGVTMIFVTDLEGLIEVFDSDRIVSLRMLDPV